MTKAEVFIWIATRQQWSCERCGRWNWRKAGDWLDKYSRCYCGQDEPRAALNQPEDGR